MQYFNKGHRGIIYTDLNRKIIVKISDKKRILNEVKWLKKLNRYKIGPKLIIYNSNYLILRHIKGKKILDYLKESNKKQILPVIKEILLQCRILDKLKINKLEMHHPVKHIIINRKVNLIDFERAYKTKNTKNLTQFCQFLLSKKVQDLLMQKNIFLDKNKFILILKKYKKKQNESNFLELSRIFND